MSGTIPEKGGEPRAIRYATDQLMLELAHRLLDQHLATRAQVDALTTKKAYTNEALDRLFIKDGIVEEKDVLLALSAVSGIPFRPIADFTIAPELTTRLPPRVALRHQIVPIKYENGTLTLASFQVPDLSTVDSLRMLLNCAMDWILCTQFEIQKSLKHFYGLGAEAMREVIEMRPSDEVEIDGQDLAADNADPGIIRFVNQMIHEAIRMDATDIHIEPFENELRLRYRIDGILQEVPLPHGIQKVRRSLISCIKIMAQMNISERRKPHDGRIKVRIGKEEFDLRASVLPSRFGETAALRILNREAMFIDLEKLGLLEHQLPLLRELSELPHGIVLITGPTGSGKTTTLYALLSRLNNADVKIITVEDPVEYQMRGISQIQVHSEIGLKFDTILRSILRHDPDIILIGEIRDAETADIAVRSSLTGHLVFSTLHTNDAPSAITRLIDMGIEPYLVSSCLEGVVAQRLVRRICSACQREVPPDATLLAEITASFPERAATARFHMGHGCPNCNFTGYRGRVAIFEVLMIDDAVRSLIVHQKPANEIRNVAVANGLMTLRQNGWIRVLDGLTSVEEVLRVARKPDAVAAVRQ